MSAKSEVAFDVTKYQDSATILNILRTMRTVAIVGLSSNPLRASHFVGYYLKRHGYRVIPVNPREREVLEQMAQGRNNAGIAQALFLSERAVEKHINSLFSKLGLSEEPDVHRRVKAVLLFLAQAPAQGT